MMIWAVFSLGHWKISFEIHYQFIQSSNTNMIKIYKFATGIFLFGCPLIVFIVFMQKMFVTELQKIE